MDSTSDSIGVLVYSILLILLTVLWAHVPA